MYFGRKYYDQAALVSIMIFNEPKIRKQSQLQ